MALPKNFLTKRALCQEKMTSLVHEHVSQAHKTWKVSIGDHSWIGDDVVLYSLGVIEIGSNTVISQKCYLCTASHDYHKESFDTIAKSITVGNGCWLATDVFVAPGISIGEGAIIGARSSVFKNIEARTINIGSPTKNIGNRIKV